MEKITEHLYRSGIDRPFGNEVRTSAYLLVRETGNLLFYSSKWIEESFDFIRERGGVSLQILNHRDEASRYCDLVLEEFGAPLLCHEKEVPAVSEKCKVGKTVTEGAVLDDLEAIHTPGHAPGSTCFLWKESVLFSGDTLYPKNGVWSVAIQDGKQEEMIRSLKKLRDREVSYIVPSLFIGADSFGSFDDRNQYNEILDLCMERLKEGALH